MFALQHEGGFLVFSRFSLFLPAGIQRLPDPFRRSGLGILQMSSAKLSRINQRLGFYNIHNFKNINPNALFIKIRNALIIPVIRCLRIPKQIDTPTFGFALDYFCKY